MKLKIINYIQEHIICYHMINGNRYFFQSDLYKILSACSKEFNICIGVEKAEVDDIMIINYQGKYIKKQSITIDINKTRLLRKYKIELLKKKINEQYT